MFSCSNIDTSKLLLLLFFKRFLFCSVVVITLLAVAIGFVVIGFFIGWFSGILFISVAEEARLDKIEMRSVFEQTIPGSFMVGKGIPTNSEHLLEDPGPVYLWEEVDVFPVSSICCTSQTFSLLVFHIFILTFRAVTMSSMMSSWRLWMDPRCSVDGGPAKDSLLAPRIRGGACDGYAAMDSRRLLPKRDVGTFDMVTTLWRRPPGLGAGAVERVARKAASRGEGPSPPLSESRRTWNEMNKTFIKLFCTCGSEWKVT